MAFNIFKLFTRKSPVEDEEFNFYAKRRDLQVDDEIDIVDFASGRSVARGVIVERHADNPRYHNQQLIGDHPPINTGDGYYRARVWRAG